MTDDVMPAAMATWAADNLPARLEVAATAKLLGFAEHDIQVLMPVHTCLAALLAPHAIPQPDNYFHTLRNQSN